MELEAIIAELNKNPTVMKGVLAHVLQQPEGTEALNNFAVEKVNQSIAETTSKIYNGIDNDLNSIFGSFKPADKKTVEYLKEIAAEVKTLREKPIGDKAAQDKIKELETKYTEVSNKLKDNGDWQAKYNNEVRVWEAKAEEFNTTITGLKGERLQDAVGTQLATGLASLKFTPGIPETVVNNFVENTKAEIVKHAKIEDGKVVFYKADGTKYLNELFKPVTAQELLKTQLKEILAGDTGGGGSQPTKTGVTKEAATDGKETKKLILDPDKFKTKVEFSKEAERVLIENGVEKNSKEWHDMTMQARTDYGVDKMARI